MADPIQQVGAATAAADIPVYYIPPPEEPENLFAAFWSSFLATRNPWATEWHMQRLKNADPQEKARLLLAARDQELKQQEMLNETMSEAGKDRRAKWQLAGVMYQADTNAAIQRSRAHQQQVQATVWDKTATRTQDESIATDLEGMRQLWAEGGGDALEKMRDLAGNIGQAVRVCARSLTELQRPGWKGEIASQIDAFLPPDVAHAMKSAAALGQGGLQLPPPPPVGASIGGIMGRVGLSPEDDPTTTRERTRVRTAAPPPEPPPSLLQRVEEEVPEPGPADIRAQPPAPQRAAPVSEARPRGLPFAEEFRALLAEPSVAERGSTVFTKPGVLREPTKRDVAVREFADLMKLLPPEQRVDVEMAAKPGALFPGKAMRRTMGEQREARAQREEELKPVIAEPGSAEIEVAPEVESAPEPEAPKKKGRKRLLGDPERQFERRISKGKEVPEKLLNRLDEIDEVEDEDEELTEEEKKRRKRKRLLAGASDG
jgi:hypothetical protein